jgi:hypothetical protein
MLSRRVLAATSRLARPTPTRLNAIPAARFSTINPSQVQKGVREKEEIEVVEPDDPEMVCSFAVDRLPQN